MKRRDQSIKEDREQNVRNEKLDNVVNRCIQDGLMNVQ
jgi:hypothetical protein